MPGWGPSWWGKLFTGSADWQIRLDATAIRIEGAESTAAHPISKAHLLAIDHGLIWATVRLGDGPDAVVVKGIPNHQAADMKRVMKAAAAFTESTGPIVRWWTALSQELARRENTWLTMQFTAEWEARRPDVSTEFLAVHHVPELRDFVAGQPAQVTEAIERWSQNDLGQQVRRRNALFCTKEEQRYGDFFRTVEKSP